MAPKPKSVIILGAAALVIAAVAAYFLFDYLRGQERKVKEAVATEQVVVAAAEIPTGTVINSMHVKAVNWPKASTPAGALLSSQAAEGRVAIERYLPGEPIIEAKLAPKEGQTGILTYRIPEGHRAMTVGVDQVAGVAGFISPGNKVDVVLTIQPLPGVNSQPLSRIVLQNIPILATGQAIEQQKDGKPVVVPTMTMDVTPEDAEKLAIASTQGRLQLILRRSGDAEIAKTAGSTVMKVISGVAAPVSPDSTRSRKRAPVTLVRVNESPAPSLIRIEVIKGTSRTTEQFKAE